MSNLGEDRELWRLGRFTCVMVSCCSGAELQVRESPGHHPEDGAGQAGIVVLRELYPTKSDLYERARDLRSEYQARACQVAEKGPSNLNEES
jgi:hypothetical protein